MQDADMGLWKYGYDAAGNVVTQTDALYQSNPSQYADHQLFFSYDKMNRVTDKYYGSTHSTGNMPDVVYYYDDALGDASTADSWGKLRQVNVVGYGSGVQGSSKSNGHGYVYDFKGRPVEDVVTTTSTYTSRPYITSYTYDVGDRLTSMTYPNPGISEVVTTTYNSQGMGLPASMTSNVGSNPNPVYDTTYNEWGELTSLRQGSAVQSNLLTTQFAYNVRGWLTNTLATTINGTQTLTHLNMVYGYDANGNVKSLTNTAVSNPNSTTNPTFSNAYSYDWLDRLASGSSTAVGIGGASLFPTETYQYDNLDRMTTRSIGGVLYPYAYTDPAHIDAPTSYHNNSYSYDANGDQLTGTVNGSSQTRTYDQERRLVQVVSGSTTSTFIYDGNDQRLIQNVSTGSTTTRTLYIGSFYEETLTGAPNPPYIVYYTLGSKMVGMRRANQPGINTNGQFRVVGDQLGSTTLIIDTASVPNVTQREYYKPFGEVAFSSGSSRTDKGFTGQRLDSGSGLMYYGARYYDPVLSYFVSPDPTTTDPSNAMDWNRYLYARGNPLRFIDTTGYGPNDYYVGVYGCSDPSNPNSCNDPHGFGEYSTYLYNLYVYDWHQDWRTWDDWAYGPGHDPRHSTGHLRTVPASNFLEGASNLRSELKTIPGNANINLLGHSNGGAAILEYLIEAELFPEDDPIDKRISSIALIAPLNDVLNYWSEIGVPIPDIASYVSGHTRVPRGHGNEGDASEQSGILQVVVPNSFVHSYCISGFDCRVADYSSRRGEKGYPPDPSPFNDTPLDPTRRLWHNWSYKTIYGSNYIDWYQVFWP